jgi:hypothetical protein
MFVMSKLVYQGDTLGLRGQPDIFFDGEFRIKIRDLV